MGIFHYWSHASGFPVVLSAVVSRPHLGSNERICPRGGSVTGWSERISRSLVRLSISNLYADSKGVRNAKRREEGGTHESCFERSAALLKQHGSALLSFHALSRADGHRLESNEELAGVCDLIQEAGYDHPFEGISPGYVPEKDWLPFLRHVRHAPKINPEGGRDYLDAADRWRLDHGYPLPSDDADFVSLVERTLLR